MRPFLVILRVCDAMMVAFITWAAIDAAIQARRRRRVPA